MNRKVEAVVWRGLLAASVLIWIVAVYLLFAK